jgi:hypothetical protein
VHDEIETWLVTHYISIPFGIPEIGSLIRITMKGDPPTDETAWDARVQAEAREKDGQRILKVCSVFGNQAIDIRESEKDIYFVR